MLEDIRDLLRRIDLLVDSESRRMNDEIDELKIKLKELQDSGENIISIHSQVKELTREIDSLREENKKLKKRVKELEPLEEKTIKQEEQLRKAQQRHEGYTFTIKVISKWIPSQKENIDVLVALSSAVNHESTFEELQKETTIPSVTLKNRIIPILAENSLVKVKKEVVKLTIAEIE